MERIDLIGQDLAAPVDDEQLLAVHEALDILAKDHPAQAEVVKLRYFVGMTNEETAHALGISVGHGKELLDICPRLDFQPHQEFLEFFRCPDESEAFVGTTRPSGIWSSILSNVRVRLPPDSDQATLW